MMVLPEICRTQFFVSLEKGWLTGGWSVTAKGPSCSIEVKMDS
jgi:hypothetical protein